MLLDTEGRYLQIQLASAVNTNELDTVVEYEDEIGQSGKIPVVVFGRTNGTNIVVLLEAPKKSTSRHVIEAYIFNRDVVNAVILVAEVYESGVRDICSSVLVPGDTLQYNRFEGWKIKSGGGLSSAVENYRKITANSAVTLSDDIIDVDAATGDVTVTFNPSILASATAAKEVKISKIDASANQVHINNGSADVMILTSISSVNMYAANGILRES